MTERCEKKTRRRALKGISDFLSKQFLAELPFFLKDVYGKTGLLMEDFYSIFTFETPHNLQLAVSKLLKNCLIQCSSSVNVDSHPARPSEKQKRLILLTRAVPIACNGSLAHVKENYAQPRLHMIFNRRKKAHSLTVCAQGTDYEGCRTESFSTWWLVSFRLSHCLLKQHWFRRAL